MMAHIDNRAEDPTISDLEWVAYHKGWSDLTWVGNELLGWIQDEEYGWSQLWVPRYDRSVDLMITLVQELDEHYQDLWFKVLFRQSTKPDAADLINASASARLAAYRYVILISQASKIQHFEKRVGHDIV